MLGLDISTLGSYVNENKVKASLLKCVLVQLAIDQTPSVYSKPQQTMPLYGSPKEAVLSATDDSCLLSFCIKAYSSFMLAKLCVSKINITLARIFLFKDHQL